MKKTFAIAAAALAVLATPAAAKDVQTVEIKIVDLDLTQAADQAKLQRRINNAARRICNLGGFDTGVRKAQEECRRAIIESVAPKVELAIAAARTERLATIDLDIRG